MKANKQNDGKWWDISWNPVVGCSKCSPGCLNCWAEKMAYRLACMRPNKYRTVITNHIGKWNGCVAMDESALDKPLHWHKPRRIFVCDMGDLFHEKVPFEFIDKVMDIINICRQHTFLFLTKRPKRILKYIEHIEAFRWHSNILLGVTVCTNVEKWKINVLRAIPAAHRFVCFEPLLHRMGKLNLEGIDWVIIGCESRGAYAGRFQEGYAEAALDIIRQCKAAGVPVYHKQMPINGRVSKNMAEWPPEFRVRTS